MVANSNNFVNSYSSIFDDAATSYHRQMIRGEDKQKIRAEKLRLLRRTHSYAEMARVSGVNQSYLSQIANEAIQSKGKNPRALSDDYASRLEKAFNLPYGWFDLPIDGGNDQAPYEPGEEFVPVERVSLKVSAGISGFNVQHVDGNGPPIFFRADWLASKGWKASNLYALRVCGDSMEPGLWADDLVVINIADTEPADGEVFVVNYEGEAIIKRLHRDSGEWWLTSDNERHKPKRCDENAIMIGRVIYKQSERI